MTDLEELGYLCHEKTVSYQKKLEETIAFIEQHKNYAVCVSWGKDSVVLTHLVAQIHNNPIVINGRYPNPNERLADEDKVRDSLLKIIQCNYQEVITPGEWEMYQNEGSGGFISAFSSSEKKWLNWWKKQFAENMLNQIKLNNCEGQLWGLCKDESFGRKVCINHYGQSYTRKDGIKIAHPLAKWSAKDIWAYHAVNNLDYLRIYDVARRGREMARSGFAFAASAVNGKDNFLPTIGVWHDLELAYKTEFHAWLNEFPNLRIGFN